MSVFVWVESGAHTWLRKVTSRVKGQVVVIGLDVLPWDLCPLRDNPLIGIS